MIWVLLYFFGMIFSYGAAVVLQRVRGENWTECGVWDDGILPVILFLIFWPISILFLTFVLLMHLCAELAINVHYYYVKMFRYIESNFKVINSKLVERKKVEREFVGSYRRNNND